MLVYNKGLNQRYVCKNCLLDASSAIVKENIQLGTIDVASLLGESQGSACPKWCLESHKKGCRRHSSGINLKRRVLQPK
jgi:hypothetical protein